MVWHKKIVLMLDLFQLSSPPDVNWWTVDYCDVFIRCLDSDGTHSLQSIHCWDTDAMLHFSKSDEGIHLSTSLAWGEIHLEWIFIVGWTLILMLDSPSKSQINVIHSEPVCEMTNALAFISGVMFPHLHYSFSDLCAKTLQTAHANKQDYLHFILSESFTDK